MFPDFSDEEFAFLMALRRSMDERASAKRFEERSGRMTSAIFEKNSAKKLLLDPERRIPGHPEEPSCNLSLAMRGVTRALVGKAIPSEQALSLLSIVNGPIGEALDTVSSGMPQTRLSLARSTLSSKLSSFADSVRLDDSLPQASDEKSEGGSL